MDGNFADGQKVKIRMITIHRISNNKIAEDWVLVESLGLFQQLGMLPSPEELFRNFTQNASSRSE